MIDWTQGVAFRVNCDQYREGGDDCQDKVIVCAECFDSADGPQDLEEEDIFECAESLIEAEEPDECFCCHQRITPEAKHAWDVIHERARASGVEEGRRLERERLRMRGPATEAVRGARPLTLRRKGHPKSSSLFLRRR